MLFSWYWLQATLLYDWLIIARGHGRLLEPPSRASMWRFGYPTPPDYNDNQQSCGGRQVQWEVNNGKCGICGDRWDKPRDHETGGKYASNIIVRNYTEGQTISITVEVTASHRGYFEFRLCPHGDLPFPVTQTCLDKHVLHTLDGNVRTPETGGGMYNLKYQLPGNIICDQCLLQWRWNTGNSWGCNFNKTNCCLGCGPQEQFYACADVGILPAPTSVSGSTSEHDVNQAHSLSRYTSSRIIHYVYLFVSIYVFELLKSLN